MITRIKATNYRCYRTLDFKPREGLNIIVGDNDSGKSTLLEIISLVISGRVRGRWAAEDLNPHWFNADVVREYFDQLSENPDTSSPEIDLEVYFAKNTPRVESLFGIHNTEKEDLPGLRMRVIPDTDYMHEMNAYLGGIRNGGNLLQQFIPTELYKIEWFDFSGEQVLRQPRGLGTVLINNQTSTTYTGVDYRLRQLIRDFVLPEESVKIGLAYREAKTQISNDSLRAVNNRILEQSNSFNVSLDMDYGAGSNWDTVVAPHIENIPFSMLGQGRQVATKVALAMARTSNTSQYVLIEEPENHLSHTQMHEMLSEISRLAEGRQLFITTHSSFALNRLGLDSLALIHRANITHFESEAIPEDTIRYFQRQPGYDTLRLVIATKVVMVEGPSDEMVFTLAYKNKFGRAPRDDGIDIITIGTSGRRGLELAKALNRKAAVLRDNDGQDPEHWEEKVEDLLDSHTRKMFIGDVALGETLETQITHYEENISQLGSCFRKTNKDELLSYMLDTKTEWSWRALEANLTLRWPPYIADAIEFIHAV